MTAVSADVAALIDDVWMTTAEVAAYTKRSANHIRRLAARGTIRSTSAGRGCGRRYRKSWVDEWVHGDTARSHRNGRTS